MLINSYTASHRLCHILHGCMITIHYSTGTCLGYLLKLFGLQKSDLFYYVGPTQETVLAKTNKAERGGETDLERGREMKGFATLCACVCVCIHMHMYGCREDRGIEYNM